MSNECPEKGNLHWHLSKDDFEILEQLRIHSGGKPSTKEHPNGR